MGESRGSGTGKNLMREPFIKVWEGAREQQGTAKHPRSCHRRIHHPRPQEMSGFAAPGSGKGSSCGRGGRIRVLWPQGRREGAHYSVAFRRGGLGRLKSPARFSHL